MEYEKFLIFMEDTFDIEDLFNADEISVKRHDYVPLDLPRKF